MERDSEDSCSIKYLKDNGISLVGAVHDFISLGGALREVNEELGIILNPKDGKRISRICREQTRDLYDVWVFYKDVDISDITLQETEVVDVKWVTDEELIKMERKGELHPLLALTM